MKNGGSVLSNQLAALYGDTETPLAYYYKERNKVLIMPEKSESKYADSALTTERRYIVQPRKVSFKSKVILLMKASLWGRIYDSLLSK